MNKADGRTRNIETIPSAEENEPLKSFDRGKDEVLTLDVIPEDAEFVNQILENEGQFMEPPTIEEILTVLVRNGREILAELLELQDPELFEKKNRESLEGIVREEELSIPDDLMTVINEISSDELWEEKLEFSYLSVEIWCSHVAQFLFEICEKEYHYSPKSSSRSLFRMFDRALTWDEPKDDMEQGAIPFIRYFSRPILLINPNT